MRLTRHAKNYLRRLGASVEDVEQMIEEPIHFDRDRRGKPRYTGQIRGVRVRVVVALDEPDLVVTIHDRRR
jgi:mRNA-degrading endonuclease RelE of RelBE toxin-antitoxin system